MCGALHRSPKSVQIEQALANGLFMHKVSTGSLRESLVGLGFPLVVLAFVATYLQQSWGLSFRSVAFPYTLIVVLVALTLTEMVRTSCRGGRNDPLSSDQPVEAINGRHVVLPVALFGYLLMFDRLGAFVATAVFLAVTMPLLGYRSPRGVLLIISTALLLIHLVFIELFFLPLPGRFT